MNRLICFLLCFAGLSGKSATIIYNQLTTNKVAAGSGVHITVAPGNPGTATISSTGGGGGGAVDSVNGFVGVVVLNTTDIAEALNLYWTANRSNNLVLSILGPTNDLAFLSAANVFSASNHIPGAFEGSGINLTNLNASQLAIGTVPSARYSGAGVNSVKLGSSAAAGGNSTSIGRLADSSGSNSIAIGFGALGQNQSSTALGDAANAAHANATAIGQNSSTTKAHQIMLGTSSEETRAAGTLVADGVITGNGAGLTNVPAASLTGSGTLPTGVLPSSVSLLGQTIDLAAEVVGVLPGSQAAFAPGNNITFTTNSGVVTVAGSSGSGVSVAAGTNVVLTTNSGVVTIAGPDIMWGMTTTNTITNSLSKGTMMINIGGGVTATSFSGSGAPLTTLTAANVTGTGTLPDGVLSVNVPLLNAANVFTASNHIPGAFEGSALNLTNLNASQLATGTVPAARIGDISGGSGLTASQIPSLDASKITTGTFGKTQMGSLSNHSDVKITGTAPTAGQLLQFDGVNWTNVTLAAGSQTPWTGAIDGAGNALSGASTITAAKHVATNSAVAGNGFEGNGAGLTNVWQREVIRGNQLSTMILSGTRWCAPEGSITFSATEAGQVQGAHVGGYYSNFTVWSTVQLTNVNATFTVRTNSGGTNVMASSSISIMLQGATQVPYTNDPVHSIQLPSVFGAMGVDIQCVGTGSAATGLLSFTMEWWHQ